MLEPEGTNSSNKAIINWFPSTLTSNSIQVKARLQAATKGFAFVSISGYQLQALPYFHFSRPATTTAVLWQTHTLLVVLF